MTMSISCAPACTACSVSATLIDVKLWPLGNAVETEHTRTALPRRCSTQSATRSGYTQTDATDGIEWSPGFRRIALAHSAATLPGVSWPSSVVRSTQRMARSSAQSFEDFLIERLASDSARSSAPTSSTLRTPRISEPRWVSDRAVAMRRLCDAGRIGLELHPAVGHLERPEVREQDRGAVLGVEAEDDRKAAVASGGGDEHVGPRLRVHGLHGPQPVVRLLPLGERREEGIVVGVGGEGGVHVLHGLRRGKARACAVGAELEIEAGLELIRRMADWNGRLPVRDRVLTEKQLLPRDFLVLLGPVQGFRGDDVDRVAPGLQPEVEQHLRVAGQAVADHDPSRWQDEVADVDVAERQHLVCR